MNQEMNAGRGVQPITQAQIQLVRGQESWSLFSYHCVGSVAIRHTRGFRVMCQATSVLVPLPNHFAVLPFALQACLAGVELICLWKSGRGF